MLRDAPVSYGPIDVLLSDDSVDEVMINGPGQIYVEQRGKLIETTLAYRDDAEVLRLIEQIVAPLGLTVNAAHPICDCRLPGGSRVNIIIPPAAVDGPIVTIRKFKKEHLGVPDLIEFGTLTADVAAMLGLCVKGRLNIVVAGGTGCGKTTTLNILSNFIPDDERIVTVEDTAELRLYKRHVVRLEARPADLRGTPPITIRELVHNCLRMRPERIVVGEIRGGEAFDMLQAMNTGHDGSLTTGHANSPRDMLRRIEMMTMMAGFDLPIQAIREQMASAIHLIVQQNRFPDGSRRITHITEILGMEGSTITLADIFLLRGGVLQPTGLRPRFEARLAEKGLVFPVGLFTPGNG